MKDPAKPAKRQLVGLEKCLLRGVRIGAVKGCSRGHRAHAEDVDLARLAIELSLDLVPTSFLATASVARFAFLPARSFS